MTHLEGPRAIENPMEANPLTQFDAVLKKGGSNYLTEYLQKATNDSIKKPTVENSQVLNANSELASKLIYDSKIPEGYKVTVTYGKVEISLSGQLVRTMDLNDPKNAKFLTQNNMQEWITDRIAKWEEKKPGLAVALKGKISEKGAEATNPIVFKKPVEDKGNQVLAGEGNPVG